MKRGDLVKRISVNGAVRRGTITHMSERGWVVVMDDCNDFDGSEWSPMFSSGDTGTPENAYWELDEDQK